MLDAQSSDGATLSLYTLVETVVLQSLWIKDNARLEKKGKIFQLAQDPFI